MSGVQRRHAPAVCSGGVHRRCAPAVSSGHVQRRRHATQGHSMAGMRRSVGAQRSRVYELGGCVAHLARPEDDRAQKLKDEKARIVRLIVVDVVAAHMQRLGDLVGKVDDGFRA